MMSVANPNISNATSSGGGRRIRRNGRPSNTDRNHSVVLSDGTRIRMVIIATLVLLSFVTRVQGEASTVSRPTDATTDINTVRPSHSTNNNNNNTNHIRLNSDDSSIGGDGGGGYSLGRGGNPRQWKTRQQLQQEQDLRTASSNLEERLSRNHDELAHMSPTLVRWNDLDTTTPTRYQNEESPSSSIIHDRQESVLREEEEEELDLNKRLRKGLRSIRRFLGPDHARRDGKQQGEDDADAPLPLAYRYYSRKFARPPSAGSIPIILLGPNADHWKVTGQQLQQKGFSVIACERVLEGEGGTGQSRKTADAEENVELIAKLLDALRWQNALLVACDTETMAAIEIALQLAPTRISGLILCGDLSVTSQLGYPGMFGVDEFLHQNLPCPYNVVWDGDTSEAEETPTVALDSSSSSSGALEMDILQLQQNRSLILGGGTAPHRRRPEQLAWVISRFVEENLATVPVSRNPPPSRQAKARATQEVTPSQLPFGLSKVFSQEALVVVGRMLATAIAWGTVIRICLYQYESFRSGIFDFQTRLHDILYTPEKLASLIVGFFRWVPKSFGLMFRGTEENGDPVVEPQLMSEPIETDQDTSAEEQEDAETTNESVEVEDEPLTEEEPAESNRTLTDQVEEHSEGHEDETGPFEEEQMHYGPLFFLDNVIV